MNPQGDNEYWQEALLHQEGSVQSFGPVANLDAFFSRVYNYYIEEGFWCIVLTRVASLLTLAFTILFSSFLLLFVNWYGLVNCSSETFAHRRCEDVIRGWADLQTELGLWDLTVLAYFTVFSVYWGWHVVRFVYSLRGTSEVAHFYNNQLSIPDHLLASMPWAQIVEKIVLLQETLKLCIVKDLTALDITNRIMRKDNYMIALVNQRFFNFHLPRINCKRCHRGPLQSPLLHPAARSEMPEIQEEKGYLVYGKTLEWNLRTCILNSMLDGQFSVRSAFVSPEGVRSLQRHFILLGVLNLMLLPFIMLFMVILFLLENAEELHSKRTVLGSRQWTPLSQWRIREYNELQHFFQRRLNAGNEAAQNYLALFPSQIQSIVAQSVAYISGALVGTLAFLTLLDSDLLISENFRVWDRPLLWWLGTLAGVLALSRAFIPTRLSSPGPADRAEALYEVTSHVHYLPKRWREHPALDATRQEFALMFQPRVAILLGEILSVILTPMILCFVLPARVPDLVKFINDSTHNVEGVGSLCTFATFELPDREVSEEKTKAVVPKKKVFGRGKMEKSCLTFALNHPQWPMGTHLGSSVVWNSAANHLRERTHGQGRELGKSSILFPRRGRSDESTIAEEGDESPHEEDEDARKSEHPLTQSDRALMTSFADMFPAQSQLAATRMDDSLDNFLQAKHSLRVEQVPSHIFGVMQRLGEIQDDEDLLEDESSDGRGPPGSPPLLAQSALPRSLSSVPEEKDVSHTRRFSETTSSALSSSFSQQSQQSQQQQQQTSHVYQQQQQPQRPSQSLLAQQLQQQEMLSQSQRPSLSVALPLSSSANWSATDTLPLSRRAPSSVRQSYSVPPHRRGSFDSSSNVVPGSLSATLPAPSSSLVTDEIPSPPRQRRFSQSSSHDSFDEKGSQDPSTLLSSQDQFRQLQQLQQIVENLTSSFYQNSESPYQAPVQGQRFSPPVGRQNSPPFRGSPSRQSPSFVPLPSPVLPPRHPDEPRRKSSTSTPPSSAP